MLHIYDISSLKDDVLSLKDDVSQIGHGMKDDTSSFKDDISQIWSMFFVKDYFFSSSMKMSTIWHIFKDGGFLDFCQTQKMFEIHNFKNEKNSRTGKKIKDLKLYFGHILRWVGVF